jgi:hypothetical protein
MAAIHYQRNGDRTMCGRKIGKTTRLTSIPDHQSPTAGICSSCYHIVLNLRRHG